MTARARQGLTKVLAIIAIGAFVLHAAAVAGLEGSSIAYPNTAQFVAAKPADGLTVASHFQTEIGAEAIRHDPAEHGRMSCCSKACTTVLPAEDAPQLSYRAFPDRLSPVSSAVRIGCDPTAPRRPPRLSI